MCWTSQYLDARVASQFRREIATFIRAHAVEGDFEASEMIVGELIANVARYAPGPACIDLDWRAHEPELVIHDAGPGFVPTTWSMNTEAENGRGLYLIGVLARQLVTEHADAGGMRVRAVLPVSRSVNPEPATCPLGTPYRSGKSCPYPTTRP